MAQFSLALTSSTSNTAGFLSLFWNLQPLSQFFSSVKPLQYLSRKVQGLVLYKAALSPQTRSKADLRTADSCIVCKVFPWMLNTNSLKNLWKINAMFYLLYWITVFSVIILHPSLSFCLFKKSTAGIFTESIDGPISRESLSSSICDLREGHIWSVHKPVPSQTLWLKHCTNHHISCHIMNINHTLSIVLGSSVSVALTEVFISFPVKLICIFNVNLYEKKCTFDFNKKYDRWWGNTEEKYCLFV